MSWKLNNDRPIYLQLLEQMVCKIVSGEYKSGDKLPSVREMAAEAAVSPNTMQRAFAELEKRGLVTTQRTVGRTITNDINTIALEREEIAKLCALKYLNDVRSLGLEKREAVELLNNTSCSS